MEEAWPLPSLSSLPDRRGITLFLRSLEASRGTSPGLQKALPSWSLMGASGKTDLVLCFPLRSTGLIWLVQEISYSLRLSCTSVDTWEDQAFRGWSRRRRIPVPNGLPENSGWACIPSPLPRHR